MLKVAQGQNRQSVFKKIVLHVYSHNVLWDCALISGFRIVWLLYHWLKKPYVRKWIALTDAKSGRLYNTLAGLICASVAIDITYNMHAHLRYIFSNMLPRLLLMSCLVPNYHCRSLCDGKVLTTYHKKGTTYFRLYLSHFLADFYNSFTNGNANECYTTACNCLT